MSTPSKSSSSQCDDKGVLLAAFSLWALLLLGPQSLLFLLFLYAAIAEPVSDDAACNGYIARSIIEDIEKGCEDYERRIDGR